MIDKVQKIREEVEKRFEKIKNSKRESDSGAFYQLKELLEFIDSLQEEPVSEDFEEALAMEWQGYNNRGAATVDALEDNTQELAFAKGFYRGTKWQKEKEYTCYEEAFEDGAKWQKEHMMIKAINAHCFGFQGAALFSFKLPADNYLVGSEVKVIVIKED